MEDNKMKKFLILFCASEPMSSFMNRSTSEKREAGLKAWSGWFNTLDKSITFEFGGVIEQVDTVTSNDTEGIHNLARNYAFATAESKKELHNALQNHPHLSREEAYIDILEILTMPK